jgi:hypothetical protein
MTYNLLSEMDRIAATGATEHDFKDYLDREKMSNAEWAEFESEWKAVDETGYERRYKECLFYVQVMNNVKNN